jgi:hypothetical protein
MKSILALFVLFSAGAVHASTSSSEVFKCFSTLSMDGTNTMTLGVTIFELGRELQSFYIGSNDPGPVLTEKQVLPFQDSLKLNLIQQILEAVGLTQAQTLAIETVEVFTSGDVDDDLSGVRSARFLNKNAEVLASGMFFGWGGPHKCQ